MINGVLVERTVKDVTPALQTNSDGLKKVLEDLVKQYKKQQDEMDKWKVSILPAKLSQHADGNSIYRRRITSRSYSSEPPNFLNEGFQKKNSPEVDAQGTLLSTSRIATIVQSRKTMLCFIGYFVEKLWRADVS